MSENQLAGTDERQADEGSEIFQEFVLDPLRTAALEALTALRYQHALTEKTFQAFLSDALTWQSTT